MKFKKYLLLIIAVSVFSGCISFAATYDDTSGSEFEEEIEMLSAIGIVESYYENEFLPDKLMTRAEFCKMVMQIGPEVYSDSVYYPDVPAEHFAFNEISYAYSKGIMIGYPDGYFHPDNEISLGEAVKVLVSFLGYGFMTDGTIVSNITEAKSLGILNDIKKSYTDTITRAEACKIIANSLDTPIPVVTSIGDRISYSVSGDKTLLTEYMKMDIGEGLVYANEFASVKNTEKSAPDTFSVNGIQMKLRTPADIDLIGYDITYIYKINNDNVSSYDLVYVRKNDNKIQTVKRDKYVNYDNNVFTYENEKEEFKKISISEYADFIYNGENKVFSSDIFASVAYGTFEFISTNNSNVYDIVIINDYDTYMVNAVNKDSKTIRDYRDPTRDVVLDDEKKFVLIYNEYGDVINFSDIRNRQILSVAENTNIVKAYVSAKMVEGIVSEINSDGIIIGGNQFEFTPDTVSLLASMQAGSNYICYVDCFDKVYYYIEANATTNEYVYIVKTAPGKSVIDTKALIKGYHYLNGMQVYNLSDTLTINEKLYKDITQAELDAALNENGGINQLVVAEFNDDGELNKITTAKAMEEVKNDSSYNGYTMQRNGTLMYLSEADSGPHFSYEVYITGNTPVVMVPNDITTAEDDDFETTTHSRFTNFGQYNIKAYASTKDAEYAEILVSELVDEKVGDNSRICVFKEKTVVVNEDGERLHKIYLFTSGGETVTYLPIDRTVTTAFPTPDTEDDNTVNFDDIAVGDMFIYSTDVEGYINSFVMVYDASEDIFSAPYDVTNFRLSNRIVKGEITAVSNNFYSVRLLGGEEIKVAMRKFSGFTVATQNFAGNYIVKSSTYENADIGDTIFIQYLSRVPYEIVLYKEN